MSIITIDLETFYDKEYSLSKMTTEEYINDPRFEVIGVGVKVDDGPSKWYSDAAKIEAVLERGHKEWSYHAILCHNTLFDGAILAWKYGVKPGMWFDTLSMARAIHGVEAGGSLKALASRYQLGAKGDEVINALGKRLVDFDQVSLERYGAYCRNDVDLTYGLFQRLSQGFPDDEFKLIDLTIRMFTEPTLKVGDAILIQRLEQIQAEKAEMLSGLMIEMNCSGEEEVRKQLCSNPQFAELLRSYKIPPPTKISPTTGKETYAFAKTDQGFIDLQEHENPIIQQLCAVRLGTKSTLEESRIGRFIGIGGRNRGYLPVPLRYYGAHTGRWSGLDSVNFQNLPSRNKAKKTLKNAILAPDGYVLVNSDSSQIEARVLAWLAGQQDVLTQFRNGEDVYSIFATKVFKRPISRANETERFVGKTCILGLGYGTGAVKLQQTLKQGGAVLSEEMCKDMVNIYRTLNDKILALWKTFDTALEHLHCWPNPKMDKYFIDDNHSVSVGHHGIYLPNGLLIHYPNIRRNEEGKFIYDSRQGVKSIWGGAVTENVVQALARQIIGYQMVCLAEIGYRPVLTVHDSLVYAVPADKVEAALVDIIRVMSTPPAWASGLPVTCEAKYGLNYGVC